MAGDQLSLFDAPGEGSGISLPEDAVAVMAEDPDEADALGARRVRRDGIVDGVRPVRVITARPRTSIILATHRANVNWRWNP